MMDGEEVYRTRLAAWLAAADTASLPQVKARHMAAARSWQALLDDILALKANSQTEMAKPKADETI